MSERIGIGIIGCGAVGAEVCRILLEQGPDLAARCGVLPELRHVVVRDADKARCVSLPDGVLSTDRAALMADGETTIVAELAGGVGDARVMTLEALSAGKDVVTANKALLALHGRAVFAAARRAGRCIAFEAAVAGGIPLIESVRRGLIANRIDAVYGILNGTCNYILTRMLENNASYAHALAEAQRLGYAEADPTLDVDGTDSAHKLAILASIAMRQACAFDQIYVRGIQDIVLTDLIAGGELGYACKLLAVARRYDQTLALSVRPTFIHRNHPLAAVGGPFNAVSVYGDAVGHALFYGRGAGGRPTASAVVADIIDIATGNAGRTFERFAALPDQTRAPVYRPAGENIASYYIRVNLADRPGGIGKVTTVLGDAEISIAAAVQHDPMEEHADDAVPVIVTTRQAKDRDVREALAVISQLDVVVGEPVCIPVLDDAAE